jgi:hypothetical protein
VSEYRQTLLVALREVEDAVPFCSYHMKDPNGRDRRASPIGSPIGGGLIFMNRKVAFCNCGAKLLGPSRVTTISGYLNAT